MLDNGKADCVNGMKRHTAWLESRAVQNAIFTNARFSVMVTDENGIVQLFNAGAERMLGYSSAEVVDKIHLVDFHDPQEVMARTRELNLEFSTAIAAGFETLIFKACRGIEDGYELAYLCKDGTRLPASISISALRDDRDIHVGYLVIGADDSVRKRLESRLNKALSDAENANLAKADCLSNMSHELRTPLNAILGFAQLMASGLPPPTSLQKRNIDLILEAGWHQQKLIDEVLDLALIESGKRSLSLQPLSLTEIMRECRVLMEVQAQTRGVELIFPTVETSHFVKADRIRIQQVLMNLLSHAINNGKTGAAVVVDYDMRNPQAIRFRIRHRGGGLSADHRSQLCQPLDRVADATAVQGTASGMAFTQRLVELMGGIMGVGGSLGTELVLWFELKRIVHPPNAVSPLACPSSEQAADPAARALRKIRV